MEEYIKKSDAEIALLALRKGYRRTEEKCAVDGCILEIKDLPTVDVVPLEQFVELKSENDVLKRLINGEWVDCKNVQEALGIDFATGLKMFDFSRTVEWNPYPLNGQKITVKFKLKNPIKRDPTFTKQELEDLICGCSAQIQEFCVSDKEIEPFEKLICKLERMVGDQN